MSSDVQVSVSSEVFAHVESRFNHFRTVIHPSARVAAIYAIDKEIDEQIKAVDAAKLLLRSLLARRNALAPISVLPPEILARVFHFLVFEDPACSREQNLGWIRATHVCRFWRQVALNDSSLWATISGISAKTELISEMWARSRNVPLDIDIHLDGASGLQVLHMFPPHLSHTRELRLHGPSMLHSGSVWGIYSREAPALEHFELRVPVRSPISFWYLGGTTLFKGQAPRLRTFSLSQVLIPWSLIPRGQLTHLKIVLIKEASTTDIPSCGDLNQLIDLLVNCPGLEILALERCLPSQLAQFPHGQTIHLPRLSRLSLGGSSSRITNLMKMLRLPSSTKLHLRCISEYTSAHNDHLLLPVVSAQLQGSAPVEFKYLSITLGCMWEPLVVTASTSVPASRIRQFQGFEDGMDDDDNEFVLSFDRLPELGHRTDLFEGVCKMLPISNLEFLSLCASGSLNWVELFKPCTKLTTLQVIGPGTSSLVRALTAPKVANARRSWNWKKRRDRRDNTPAQPAGNTAAHAHMRIFPKLKLLSLKGLDFSEKEQPSGILFDVVDKVLRQRKAPRKAPLRMLRIDNCAISARRAKALQRLVQEFHWDGKEVFDEHEDVNDYLLNWEAFTFDSGTDSSLGSDAELNLGWD
ncbi:hypothetical protein DFH94DRAFT_849382 [Russula ochroleuca]|jgi:hypothetical protein|uniref:F-box domain-containing protein n=1 Tax=Russula ochroleuca TaxID=152965 RepID=A0A9P5N5Q5_9AGAM|nr:hypothetical protein DFH94DRAFT_849382 [Russula ochroleuca]